MKHKTLILAVVVIALLVVTGQPLMAQNGNVWNINYYANTSWSGTPAMAQADTYIDFNWGTVPPGPGMPSTNWTATMTSSVNFYYTGTYTFRALADDEVSLQIDGVTYINTMGAGMSGKPVQVSVSLNQGTHNLVVQYRQYTDTAYVYLNWAYQQPGGGYIYTPLPTPMPNVTPQPTATGPTPTPSCDPWWECSCPTSATSVTTEYGNYTSCIQNNEPQSACYVSDGQWDAPNMGSIDSEPTIQVWGNCTPGQLQCMQLACNQEPVQATCSKTGAGWFYYGACPAGSPVVQ
ncbi:MAG: hypothetical protein KDI07_00590 [Anaerolineae bacterium]|nr:hypothetical protein [Anaerolineae bacterium]MCB9131905.1 hypothetical protein [Anaerolineales bacterium]MCB0227786.1 hypothetical protein [Anaerolineae bacterium]MCB0233843.1 hypothetical protein [Anaerolineae bacterium]MCB0238938.1 hypothetical protein [Anaerolineae bacterium]